MAAFSNEYHALVELISTKAERDFKWNEFFEQAIFEAAKATNRLLHADELLAIVAENHP